MRIVFVTFSLACSMACVVAGRPVLQRIYPGLRDAPHARAAAADQKVPRAPSVAPSGVATNEGIQRKALCGPDVRFGVWKCSSFGR